MYYSQEYIVTGVYYTVLLIAVFLSMMKIDHTLQIQVSIYLAFVCLTGELCYIDWCYY